MRLELYYDFSSPWAYLGAVRAPAIASAHRAELVWRPILLGGLFRAIGTPLVPIAQMAEAKRRYVMVDLERWARRIEVPFVWPSRFPLRTVDALRLVLAAPLASREALTHRLMRLCWVDDGDPTDRGALRECARDAGVDPKMVDELDAPRLKDALRAATDEAVARNVPGVPTFLVGNSMFFGQDRLELVAATLAGRFVDPVVPS